jgi:hypothetical protein
MGRTSPHPVRFIGGKCEGIPPANHHPHPRNGGVVVFRYCVADRLLDDIGGLDNKIAERKSAMCFLPVQSLDVN